VDKDAGNEVALERAFAAIAKQQIGALLVASDPFLLDHRNQIGNLFDLERKRWRGAPPLPTRAIAGRGEGARLKRAQERVRGADLVVP
jgi:hypothetical protein